MNVRKLAPRGERVTDKMPPNYYFAGLIKLVRSVRDACMNMRSFFVLAADSASPPDVLIRPKSPIRPDRHRRSNHAPASWFGFGHFCGHFPCRSRNTFPVPEPEQDLGVATACGRN